MQMNWFKAFLIASTAIIPLVSAADVFAQEQRSARLQQVSYNIPAQSLTGSLTAFARASGLKIAYPAALTQGKAVPAIRGPYTRTGALEQILAGSGLSYRFMGDSAVTIFSPNHISGSVAADGSTVLETIVIQGRDESAWGPIDGYIATRSAAATKTDAAIMETPQTINIVTRDQIAMQGAQRVNQAVRYSAGVQSEGHGDVSRFDQFSFRGIGGVTDSNQFLDGLRLPRGISYLIAQTDPWHLERLELLKGPASVLYGQAPLSGIVNMVSKRPTSDPLGEVEVVFGSHNRKQVAFDVSGPVNEDRTLLYRLTGVGLDSDTSVNLTKDRRISIAPSLTWKPDEDTSLTILMSYQRDPEGGYYGFLPYHATVQATPYGRLPRDFFDGSPLANEFDRTQASIGYSFDHKFSDDWSIHQNFRYLHMDLDQSLVYSAALLPDNRTLARIGQWSTEQMNAVNVDTNLRGQFDTGSIAHNVVFGIDYQWDNWKQTFGYGLVPSLDWLNPNYGLPIPRAAASSSPDRVANLLGVYAQDQLKIGNLSLILGGRYDWASIDTENAITTQSSSQDFGKFTYRVGAIYNFDNGVAPYASYTTSFDPTVTANAYGAPFEPLTGQQFEVGIKYQLADFPGLFTLSAFDLTQQNVLTRDPTPGSPINRYVQTGEVNSKGIELEARFNPIDGLNLIASASWIDAEVTKSTGTDLGKRPVNVSRTLASLWGDYTIGSGALAGLTIGTGVRYVGSSFADTDNNLPVPSYVLADASLKYDFGYIDQKYKGLTASINVTNIFDETYYKCNSATACNYGEGRSVFGSLRYRW